MRLCPTSRKLPRMPFIPFAGGPIGAPVVDPAKPLPPPPVIRAERIDPMDGDVTSVYLDLDPIDAQVSRAMEVVRNTGAAVTEDGNRFVDAQRLDPGSFSLLKHEVKRSLARLVAAGDVEVLEVRIDTRDTGGATGLDDFAELTVRFRNLRARDKDPRTAKVRVPLRGNKP